MARKLALALALLGATAVSGCVVVKQESAAQVDGIGDAVRISAKVCLNNTNPANGPDCAADFVGVGDYQGLLALRVPADLEPPETVTTDLAGVTLTASPSYTSELERTVPAGDGLQWAGYISPPHSFVAESGPPPAGFVVNVTAELALPASASSWNTVSVSGSAWSTHVVPASAWPGVSAHATGASGPGVVSAEICRWPPTTWYPISPAAPAGRASSAVTFTTKPAGGGPLSATNEWGGEMYPAHCRPSPAGTVRSCSLV